jgi:hypothetical protein
LQNDEKIFFRLDDDDDDDEGEKVIYCLMSGLGLVGWLAVIAKCQYANKYQLLARLKDIYKNRNRKNNEQECHEK